MGCATPRGAPCELLNSPTSATPNFGGSRSGAARLRVPKRPARPKPLAAVLAWFALEQCLRSERHVELSAAEAGARVQNRRLVTPC